MSQVIGYANGLPIFDAELETRAVAHDPATGQFTSSGSGGGAARNKLMIGHALTQKHPEHHIKEMIHHLADKASKVGKPDASGKSTVHIDGEHVGHISTEHKGGTHIVTTGKISAGKTAGYSKTTAHHTDGSTSGHQTKKDAIRDLAEKHHKSLMEHVEKEMAPKHAAAASKAAHEGSVEAAENKYGLPKHLLHKSAADKHEWAAYRHKNAGNHEEATKHEKLAAHHKAEAEK